MPKLPQLTNKEIDNIATDIGDRDEYDRFFELVEKYFNSTSDLFEFIQNLPNFPQKKVDEWDLLEEIDAIQDAVIEQEGME